MKTFKHSLGSIVSILNQRIESIEEMNPPMNSHMAGILVGLIEAKELIMEEEEPRPTRTLTLPRSFEAMGEKG